MTQILVSKKYCGIHSRIYFRNDLWNSEKDGVGSYNGFIKGGANDAPAEKEKEEEEEEARKSKMAADKEFIIAHRSLFFVLRTGKGKSWEIIISS